MENEIICGIYKITSPTKRVYIGQAENIQNRFNQYRFISNSRSQTKLNRSFKKHGIKNHSFEIIEECLLEDLLCRERYWQDFYDVLNGGLNCLLTSCGDEKLVMSEETKQKISNTKKNTPQTEAQKKYNRSKFGRKITKHPEWIKNNSESRKKPIVQYSIDGDFIKDWKSAQDVENELGLSRKAISKNLRGGSKSAYGFIWKYKNNVVKEVKNEINKIS